ncbi:MAG: hypothetical protein Q7I97_04340 [Thermovirgaceae bacterium]|nr:hypothetical protein [Thermovirgaceae bacterium]
MRKGLFFWFSVLLAAGIIGGAVFFFGKTPDKVLDVTRAIPAIEAESPHLFLVVESGQIEPGLPSQIIQKAEEGTRPILSAIDDLMPLFSFAEQSAAVVAWHSNEPVFYGCFLFPKEMAADLQAGKLPAVWLEKSSGLALDPSDKEGLLQLSAGSGRLVFTVRTEGNLLMAALSPEGIEKMSRTFSGEEKRIDPEFAVERSWPAHLRLFDGLLLAQAASVRGVEAPDVPVGGEIAWNSRGQNGEIAWSLNGIMEWVPENIRTKLVPHQWKELVYLPDPLIAGAGLSIPGGLEELTDEDFEIPGWILNSGLDRKSLAALLAGPLMVTVGGQSRVLFFSLPGLLVQLPGRGGDGIKWVEGLWASKWTGLGLTPKPLEGFSAGGMLSVPLSVVAAAREDLAIAGVISNSSLGKTVPVKEVVALGERKVLLWFYADFPKAAAALENLAKVGNLADRFGVNGSTTPEEIIAAVNGMRSLGRVSLVLHDIESGRGSWNNDPPPEE